MSLGRLPVSTIPIRSFPEQYQYQALSWARQFSRHVDRVSFVVEAKLTQYQYGSQGTAPACLLAPSEAGSREGFM